MKFCDGVVNGDFIPNCVNGEGKFCDGTEGAFLIKGGGEISKGNKNSDGGSRGMS